MKQYLRSILVILIAATILGAPKFAGAVSGIPDIQPSKIELGVLIGRIMGFAFGLLVTIAALFIMYAAYLYLTSGGNSEKTESATKFITYAVVALVVAALSQTLVYIVGQLIGF